jgi:pimeloyl-ACP methyl ester carboxylesterase
VIWLWLSLGTLSGILLAVALGMAWLYFDLVGRYMRFLVRIFQETPLFIVPRVEPPEDAEVVRFANDDGLMLSGCYLRARIKPRRGVILFGIEFGADCWACVPYCQYLLEERYDVFSFEPRGHGGSQVQPGYTTMQWITDYEVRDFEAALRYLRGRPDAPAEGIGFFGVSKGGGAGLVAFAREPFVKCFVTDGIFGTYSTMVPYMRQYVKIVSKRKLIQRLLPNWFYGLIAHAGLRTISAECDCRFPHLEKSLAQRSPQPLLMIHGGADTYIKPEMARTLFQRARKPKELWIVEGAKHNQGLNVAGLEYKQRVLDFFQAHLRPSEALKPGEPAGAPPVAKNGSAASVEHLQPEPLTRSR